VPLRNVHLVVGGLGETIAAGTLGQPARGCRAVVARLHRSILPHPADLTGAWPWRWCDNGRVIAATDVPIDSVSAEAVDLARAAAAEIAGSEVGEHLGVRAEAERVVTHAFAATLPGYVGWFWAVTINRAPDAEPTVAEAVLLPGEGALLAAEWVPWSERLKPGDLSPGDLLPSAPDDPRLAPAYLLSDDPQVEEVAFELGLGRVRVLSREGRLDAADRWYAGEGGPDTPMAKQAPAPCGTCGFFLPIAGSLSAAFGVCSNEIATTDGQVVSVEHGCGAHSEAVIEVVTDETAAVYDDDAIDVVQRESAAPADELVEEPGVDAELPAVEAGDLDDATGIEAQDESGETQFSDLDPTELDRPAAVAGSIEEAPSGDAGQDVVG
jgi:hypothetical protein